MQVNQTFHVDRGVRDKHVEKNLKKQVKDYKKVLRDLYPTARYITHSIIDRAMNNRSWKVAFHVD